MRRTAPMIDSRGTMRRITWEAFARIARRAALTLPIEQTVAWDFFDAAMDGREPWGRVVYEGPDGAPRALLSLTRMSVRGIPYLWARHAPVWLGGAPTRREEAECDSTTRQWSSCAPTSVTRPTGFTSCCRP